MAGEASDAVGSDTIGPLGGDDGRVWESLFGVDLERGSEGGDKPVEVMTQQCNFALTRSQLHAL